MMGCRHSSRKARLAGRMKHFRSRRCRECSFSSFSIKGFLKGCMDMDMDGWWIGLGN